MSGFSHSPGLPCLYRAMVSSRKHEAELIVFFEAVRNKRVETLDRLLHAAWAVDVEADLEVYNLCSESELLNEWALGAQETGDMRLFEIGSHYGQPMYADPAGTLMMVTPAVLTRLYAAQQRTLPERERQRAADAAWLAERGKRSDQRSGATA